MTLSPKGKKKNNGAIELSTLISPCIEQSPVAILITDASAAIRYVNPVFTRNTGYGLKEIEGKNPRILQSGMTPKTVYKEMWTALTSGAAWHGDLCNKTKDGTIYWEAIAISPIKNENGEVQYFMAVWEDITERKSDEKMMAMRLKGAQHDAITDVLTGIYNRRHILSELSNEVHRSVRYKRRLSGMMIDLDDFKLVNNRYGYFAGDVILGEVVSLIKESIRKCDILGRYDSDAFLLILPETMPEHARIVAERIRRMIESHVFSVKSEPVKITSSIGLLAFENVKHIDEVIFVEKINEVLQRAKSSGKNRIAGTP